VSPPSSAYLSLYNEEGSKLWEVRLDDAGKLSLTPSSDPDRPVVFDAAAVLTLLVYLQERREIIDRHDELHRTIEADHG
jgi:hypothetical protein